MMVAARMWLKRPMMRALMTPRMNDPSLSKLQRRRPMTHSERMTLRARLANRAMTMQSTANTESCRRCAARQNHKRPPSEMRTKTTTTTTKAMTTMTMMTMPAILLTMVTAAKTRSAAGDAAVSHIRPRLRKRHSHTD
jgi:hypothetical protein